jgi:hypothetical protein
VETGDPSKTDENNKLKKGLKVGLLIVAVVTRVLHG